MPGRGGACCQGLLASRCSWCLLLLLGCHVATGQVYRVCMVQNPGFANCTPGADPSTFSGFEVDLMGLVAQNIGWQQVVPGQPLADPTKPAYELICTMLRVPAVVNILINASDATSNPDGLECDLGLGAFTVTSARVQNGTRFSWPHLHSSLGVMVAANTQQTSYDKWAFLKPFSPHIWAAVVVTTILTPILLSLYENIIQTGRVPVGKHLLTEWRHASYVMFLCCFNLQVLEVLSLPCQLMVVCFAFTNLITVASYTANLAAVLTAAAVETGIQTVEDLINKRVAAHAVYVDRLLKNEHIRATPLSWAGEPFFLQVKQLLVDGDLDAYIFDRPILQYYMGTDDPDCQLRLLTDTQVEPFDYGIAFNKQLPESVVGNFSLGVLQVQSTGMLPVLEERYLSGGMSTCNAASTYDNALQFGQVSGLYVILGTAAGLGLLASVYSIWWHHIWRPRKQQRKLRKEEEGAESKRHSSVHPSLGSGSKADMHVYADCAPDTPAPPAPPEFGVPAVGKRAVPLGGSGADEADDHDERRQQRHDGNTPAGPITSGGDDAAGLDKAAGGAAAGNHRDANTRSGSVRSALTEMERVSSLQYGSGEATAAAMDFWHRVSSQQYYYPYDTYIDQDDGAAVSVSERYASMQASSGPLLPPTLHEEVSVGGQSAGKGAQEQQPESRGDPGPCTAAVSGRRRSSRMTATGSIDAAVQSVRRGSGVLTDDGGGAVSAFGAESEAGDAKAADGQLPVSSSDVRRSKDGSRLFALSKTMLAAKRLAQKVFVVEGKEPGAEDAAPLAFTHAAAMQRAASADVSSIPPAPSLVSVSKLQASFIGQHARQRSGTQNVPQGSKPSSPPMYAPTLLDGSALHPPTGAFHVPTAMLQQQGSLPHIHDSGSQAGMRHLHHMHSMPVMGAGHGGFVPVSDAPVFLQRLDSSQSTAPPSRQLLSSYSSNERQVPHVAMSSADGRVFLVPVESVLPLETMAVAAGPASGAAAGQRRAMPMAAQSMQGQAPQAGRRTSGSSHDAGQGAWPYQRHGNSSGASRAGQVSQPGSSAAGSGVQLSGSSRWAQVARGLGSSGRSSMAAAAAASTSDAGAASGPAAAPAAAAGSTATTSGFGDPLPAGTRADLRHAAAGAVDNRDRHDTGPAGPGDAADSVPGSATSAAASTPAAVQLLGSNGSFRMAAGGSGVLMRCGSSSSASMSAGLSRSSSGRGSTPLSAILMSRSSSGRATHLPPLLQPSPLQLSGPGSGALEEVSEEVSHGSSHSIGKVANTLDNQSTRDDGVRVGADDHGSDGGAGTAVAGAGDAGSGAESPSGSVSFLPLTPLTSSVGALHTRGT